MKNNCCVFKQIFKLQKNGIFHFGIYFFFIVKFMRFAIKIVNYKVKNFFGNIEAVFFKLNTTNVYRKRKEMKSTLLPWKLSWLQCLSVKNKISSFSTLKVGQRVLLGTDMITVLIKTGPLAKLLSCLQHNRCHFV